MYRSFLSWRYLVARRTNLIGIVSIFLGVFAPILIYSIMSGFLAENVRFVRGSLSDVTVEPMFAERDDGGEVERSAGPLLGLLHADARVASATARLSWYGIVSQGGPRAEESRSWLSHEEHGSLSAVELVGVDVLTETRLALAGVARWLAMRGLRARFELTDELDGGAFYDAVVARPTYGARVEDPLRPFRPPPNYRPRGRPKASVLVGDELCGYFGLRRGSILHVSSGVPHPETGELLPCSREFVVAGSFRSGNTTDRERIYLARSELADMLQDGREFSEVVVDLRDFETDAPAFCDDFARTAHAAGLLRTPGTGEIHTWEEKRRAFIHAVENERVMMAIMLGLVLLVSGFTIFAILSMLVTEKKRDIGVLTALGATPRGILATFLMIGVWDAVVGSTIGAALGVWAALRVTPLQGWLEDSLGIQIFVRDVFAFDQIPSRLDPAAVAIMVILAYVCTLLFASIPAWRAARLDPIAALRYE